MSRQRLFSILLIVLFAAACSGPSQDDAIEFRVPVQVREVGTGTVEDQIVATGTLRAAEVISLRTDTAGILFIGRSASGRRLTEGDPVESGQRIAEVTGEEVRLAAHTESTYQRYMAAKRDYETKKELLDEGLMSELEFRPVETTLADAKIEWERSQLTETRSRLVTPISGLILWLARDEENRPLADGQLVPQGFTVAHVAPTDELIADVDLVGPDTARVDVGMTARIRHHAREEVMFEGEVLRLAPSLDPMTRTLRAEVVVDNEAGLLRPGMFLEVTMIADRRVDVPVVTRDAVTERGGKKVVFVLRGQRVSRREVTLGLGDDEVVEIREGLELGERVVVRGLETLTDGARVRVSGA